jgi:glutathione S-transferase
MLSTPASATLFTFRRCPYAMRARMALRASGVMVTQLEVDLKNKPAALLAASPKATVPVLVLADGQIIDESLDIMLWALHQNDPMAWLPAQAAQLQAHLDMIHTHDRQFKPLLDRYKYAIKHPELDQTTHRENAVRWLQTLESALGQRAFLLSSDTGLADIALMPFVRQFAHVDKTWFDTSTGLSRLRNWLDFLLRMPIFTDIMRKI